MGTVLHFSSIFLGILSFTCLTVLLIELWLAACFTSLSSTKYFISSRSEGGMKSKQRPCGMNISKSYGIVCVTVCK